MLPILRWDSRTHIESRSEKSGRQCLPMYARVSYLHSTCYKMEKLWKGHSSLAGGTGVCWDCLEISGLWHKSEMESAGIGTGITLGDTTVHVGYSIRFVCLDCCLRCRLIHLSFQPVSSRQCNHYSHQVLSTITIFAHWTTIIDESNATLPCILLAS